jgi:hypothetical protein
MFQDPIYEEDSKGARAEGRVEEMSFFDKLLYLQKYLWNHKKRASPACEKFYEEQRLEWKNWVQSAPAPDLRLGLVGDLMWIRRNWDTFLTPNTLNRLRTYDALMGNLETVISPNFPVNEWLPDLFRFNSKPGLIDSFQREDGSNLFSALSFANNHTLDFGDQGALDTLKFLENRKIASSGVAKNGMNFSATFQIKDIQFGFVSATFGVNEKADLEKSKLSLSCIPNLVPERKTNSPDLGHLLENLAQMERDKIKIKIICLHWGFEFEYYPTSRMLEVAQALADAGADLIFGCHPHIPHPPTILKSRCKRVLLYSSLGNFASAMYTFPCRLAPLQRIGIRRLSSEIEIFPMGVDFFYNLSWRGGRKLVSAMELPFSPSYPPYLEIQKHLGV